MASTFIATGAYTNLTRLELEQLRKADFFAGGKALTVGDSALPPEGVVGPGSISAEPFLTNPSILLDSVYSLTPPTQPGPGLGTVTQTQNHVSETVAWYGPTFVQAATTGYASASNVWTDVNADFMAVNVGDILLITAGTNGEQNTNAVATVTNVTTTALTVDHIYTVGGGSSFTVDSSTQVSGYTIVRPNAVQLFAIPASGATGHEQTFLAVTPGASIHNELAPTTDQINAARVTNLVPSQYALNTTVDRADAVYDAPGPRLSLNLLGYRLVLYTDNGSGTGPNLANPIATLTPVIDPSIPSTDQRMTIDNEAGIVRFSCEPQAGGQILVPGGVNPTTGRLNLYAVFWAVNQTDTKGASRSVYGLRSTNTGALTPGQVTFDLTNNAWRLGSTTGTNSAAIGAPDPSEDARVSTTIGTYDTTGAHLQHRYFRYQQGGPWTFVNYDKAYAADPPSSAETRVGSALEYTVGDIASPPQGGADFRPSVTINTGTNGRGTRNTTLTLQNAVNQGAIGDTGVVRLKRGHYQINGTLHVPPGVTLEGDGATTVLQVLTNTSPSNTTTTPGIKFGPNTSWGVHDLSWNGSDVAPTVLGLPSTTERLEGIDTVWNPVRRVWGTVFADVTTNNIWFNEVGLDGTTTFSGLGIAVKTSGDTLFSTLSVNSNNHTGGHYPRICYQANADQYAIVWVEQITSGVVGPVAMLQALQVNPGSADPTSGNPGGTSASYTLLFTGGPLQITPNGGTVPFSDHPSIAADNSSGSSTWNVFLQVWGYNVSGNLPGGTITDTAIYQYAIPININPSSTPSLPSANILYNGSTNYVFSSTDVDEDWAGNMLFVWSRRMHQLITGTQGVLTVVDNDSELLDLSGTNFTSQGVVSGSRFCYLGNSALPANAVTDSVIGMAVNSSFTTSYGMDGTALTTSLSPAVPTSLHVQENMTGFNFGGMLPAGSLSFSATAGGNLPYTLVTSTTTAGTSGTTLADSAANYTASNVTLNNTVYFPSSGNSYRIVTVTSSTALTLDPSFSGSPDASSGNAYQIFWYQRGFNSQATTGTSGTTLTDTAGHFVERNIVTGDKIVFYNTGNIYTVASRTSDTQLSLTTTLAANDSDGSSFTLLYSLVDPTKGTFNWALAPQSIVEGNQYTSSSGFLTTIIPIAGYVTPTSNYVVEPTEPDYVRVKRGGDNWIVIYQAMNTTAYMAMNSQNNWNDGLTTSDGTTFTDNVLYYRDNGGVYRQHISTCAVVLSANGVPLNSPYNLAITANTSSFDTKISRDTEVSNRSLGSILDPLTYRPNHSPGFNDASFAYRYAKNMGLQVSPLNFCHRWTSSSTPSLLPDITWTGEDWVVVSPTKKSIHGYCGNYHTDGSGNAFFSDPTFIFGTGSAINGGNYVRETYVPNSDSIYFPGYSLSATPTGNVGNPGPSEHGTALSSNVLAQPTSTTLTNVEWVLVRSNTGTVPAGIKSLGYRVSLDGNVIVSSSYNTFADELPDNAGTSGLSDRTPMMGRSNVDYASAMANVAQDGHNLPGNITDDIPDPEGRYMGDTGFRGIAPGQPHGSNNEILGESPFLAIAWGETFYGFAEHIAEGPPPSGQTNEVRFYRQSFGPYNSGLRNVKLIGTSQPTLNAPGSTGSELKLLSSNLVYTRHGAPASGNGFFATDGYRNFFAVADKRGLYGLNNTFGTPYDAPYGGSAQACLQGFYTDALGRYPIEMQGPEVQGKPLPGLTQSVPTKFLAQPTPNTFRCDFSQLYSSTSVPIQPSAPRVLWDGSRFIAVWVEGGFTTVETPPLLCITSFPGGEDTELQGPELVNPDNYQVMRKTAQIAVVETRNLYFPITHTLTSSSTSFTVYDVATSGKVYAVLWAAGLDANSPTTFGRISATLGVTIFENVDGAGTFDDFNPQPYSGGISAATIRSTSFELTDTGSSDNLNNAAIGDIVVVPTGLNAGRYLVTAIHGSPTTILTLYPPPPANTLSTSYTLHRPLGPSGASSTILGTVGIQQGSSIDAFTSPCITWDGKQFVAVWRGKLQTSYNTAGPIEQSIQYITFPETGFAHPQQTKIIAATTVSGGTEIQGPFGASSAIGWISPNDTSIVYLATGVSYSTGNGTIAASGSNYTYTHTGADFFNLNVCVGDLMVLLDQYVMATVIGINAADQLLLSGELSTLPTGSSIIINLYRKQTCNVQKGDILHIDTTYYQGTTYTNSTGSWPIIAVDPYENTIVLSGPLNVPSATTQLIFGSIVSGQGNGDVNQQTTTSYTSANANPYVNFGTDVSSNLRALGTSVIQAQAGVLGTVPDHIFKLLYNEVTDEYVMLYSSAGSLAIGVFDRTTFEIKRETLLFTASGANNVKVADLAWNGTRYLAVYAIGSYPLSNAPTPLQYVVITAGLQIESYGPQSTGVITIQGLLGNTVGTVPGPTYALPDFTGATSVMNPQWKNAQIRWNDRLNRWVISGSFLWINPGTTTDGASKYDMYGGSFSAPTTLEYANEYPLTVNVAGTSISGNVLNIHVSSGNTAAFIQPGMKLAWTDTTGTTTGWAGMASILKVVNNGSGNYALTLSTSSLPSGLAIEDGKLYVMVREDCFVFTLGYDTPTVQFEDADGCFLENVVFGGGTSDIEERYTRMGRPIWQSGGNPVGDPILATSLPQWAMRPSQYNHKMTSPTSKVATPRYVGVKSFTKTRSRLLPG